MILIRVILTIGFTSIFIGCASIISGYYQEITINSNPCGALITVLSEKGDVKLENETTPIILELPRGNKYFTLKIIKEGYKPNEIILVRTINGWVFGNVIFGGIIGIAIDFYTGAAYSFLPDNIFVNLEKDMSTSKDADYVLIYEALAKVGWKCHPERSEGSQFCITS